MQRPDPDGAITDPRQAVAFVDGWRSSLGQALAPQGVTLDWAEKPDGEYFTDKPAWTPYGGPLIPSTLP